MKAAVYEAFGQPLRIQNVPDPVPADDAVVVSRQGLRICRSDWHGWMGHDPDVRVPMCPAMSLQGWWKKWKDGVAMDQGRQSYGALCLRVREMSSVCLRQPSSL